MEEVLQEVGAGGGEAAIAVADAGKVAPWLYRLAVLQSLLYRRKCGRRRRLQDRYAERVARRW